MKLIFLIRKKAKSTDLETQVPVYVRIRGAKNRQMDSHTRYGESQYVGFKGGMYQKTCGMR